MLVLTGLVPYIELHWVTSELKLNSIMVKNGWDVLHVKILGGVTGYEIGFANTCIS